MFYQLGQFCVQRRVAVMAAWLVAAAALRLAAPPWSTVALDGDFDQLPADTTTMRAARLRAEAFPNDRAKSQIIVVFARSEGPLTPDDRRLVQDVAHRIDAAPDLPLVDEAWTETTPIIGSMLGSPAGHATRVVARLANDLMAVDNIRVLETIERIVDKARSDAPPGLEIGVTGSAAIGGDMLAAAAHSLRNTDRLTIVLVTLALAIIYRSPWLVAVPLATIGIAAVVSLDLLALLAGLTRDYPALWPDVRVFTTTRIFIVVLLFGVGTDFCLFLVARFRELRREGVAHRESVARALDRVGGAIAASALTTIAGLAMMAFADFGKFAYSGPAIAVSLAIALAVCLTLAPALLATPLGGRVELAVDAAPRRWDRLWGRIADIVCGRPGLVLATTAMIAAPLIWYGSQAPVTYDVFSELAPKSTSRRGAALLLHNFPAGEVGPLVVLAHRPTGGLTDDDGRYVIAELNKLLGELPGVDRVRSLYRPTGEPPGAVQISASGLLGAVAANSPIARDAFVAELPDGRGDVTRMYVTLQDPPFSAAAVKTVNRMEAALEDTSRRPDSSWHGARFEFLGPTSGIRDLERVTSADRRRIEVMVTAAVFAVILALLRRPVMCAFLILTVIAGYLTTLGVVRGLLGFAYGPDYPGLDWKAPVFLFVILVAVGQDYNIYLVTRVLEEQRRHGPLVGLRRAMVQTGGIITSCGVIMAVTFGSMISGSLRGMVELGLALSIGILLDTFVVRPVVVPAFLALLAKRRVTLPPAA